MAETSAASAAAKPIDVGANVRQEVADALYLLDYAVASGVKTAEGVRLSQDIVTTIKSTAEKLGALKPASETGTIAAADWAAFELAYYDLSIALAPVTAETLRNTAVKPREQRTFCDWVCGDSAAIRFTRALWLITGACAAFIIYSAWFMNVSAEDGNLAKYVSCRVFLEIVTPWVYGGLGACVYLLRSAHVYIHQRCFDVRRKPEYLNRILLGAVAGGAILLFVSQITDDEGNVIKLSSAALGFLAGYNTDFLFKTIERVAEALLPKVGIDSVQRAQTATQTVNLNDLAARLEKAEGADKDLLRSVIAQVTGARLPTR